MIVPKEGFRAKERDLSAIAEEIRIDWLRVSPYAEPYLEAMESLTTIDQSYGLDPGSEIVARFLSNAQGWRGSVARKVKEELRQMLRNRGWL